MGPSAPRILLAEDEPELRHLLAASLRRAGYEVVEAGTGIEVLDQLAESLTNESGIVPSLVVSDVRMPGLGGLEILEALRPFHGSVPVILITAFGDAEIHAQALQLGAAAVLDKPFELSELQGMVGRFVLKRAG